MKYQYDFEIAGVRIRWISEKEIKLKERYVPFLTDDKKEPDVTYTICEGYPEKEPDVVSVRLDRAGCRIIDTANYRYRACAYDCSDYSKEITLVRPLEEKHQYWLYIPKDAEEVFLWEDIWTYYMAFEEMLYYNNRIILHASSVETDQGALLFVGASGCGKSTQAELWSRYAGTFPINGDRTILYEQDGKILASGSPYAGTSGIYRNHQSSVRAVFLISHGTENKLQRLGGKDILLSLLGHSNYRFMDQKMKEYQMEILLKVAESIPVYAYEATPDEQAVRFLQEYLRETYFKGE